MIKSIDDQLKLWGLWVVRSDARGLGYPSVSPMFRDTPACSVHRSAPPPGVFSNAERVEMINSAVAELGAADRALCYECYVVTGRTRAQVAVAMAIHRDTLYARLDALHALIDAELRQSA